MIILYTLLHTQTHTLLHTYAHLKMRGHDAQHIFMHYFAIDKRDH